jgi:1-acyl-sn-glycerol-3-phosphate acyltransferase
MPDIKPQQYKDPRPAEVLEPFHERTRSRAPDWMYSFVRMVTTPVSLFIYRTISLEVDNVPASGPVILAPNHFSIMDHFLIGAWLRRRINFMAKSQIFRKNPVLDFIFRHGGVFPVRRGHADQEAFLTVRTILERGGCLLIYCEGGRSRSGELGQARPGVGRAALESGAPVVPIAILGSQDIRGWRRLAFPKVTVRFGEPISFPVEADPDRDRQQETADEIFAKVRVMYEELARDGRRTVVKRIREARAAGEGGPRYS